MLKINLTFGSKITGFILFIYVLSWDQQAVESYSMHNLAPVGFKCYTYIISPQDVKDYHCPCGEGKPSDLLRRNTTNAHV